MTIFLFEGSDPKVVKAAFRAARKKGDIEWCVPGKSFALRIDGDSDFPRGLTQEFSLATKEIKSFPSPQVTSSEKGRRGKKEMPPKEELLEKAQKFTLKQLAESYGVSVSKVSEWLKNIPEAKDIQRTYTCQECGATFTGLKARWEYINHVKYQHRKVKLKKEVPTAVLDDETVLATLIAKSTSLKQEIERLKTEKEKAVAEWDAKIRAAEAAKEEFRKKILDALS